MKTREVSDMRDNAMLAIRGDRMPPELSAALEGSEAGAVYAVHIKKLSVEDAAEFLEIRAKVQEGIAALEAGDVFDEDEAFAEIERLAASKSV
jgi:predicted transcriptional regulator